MPLTREQTKYVPTNDTVFLPTVAIDRNLGVRGSSVFDSSATFNNGITVTAGNSVFSGPLTGSSGFITTDLLASGQVSLGTPSFLAQLTVIPTIATRRGLQIRGAVGQSTELFRIETSAASNIFSVGTSTISITVPITMSGARITDAGNVWLNSPTASAIVNGKYIPALYVGPNSQVNSLLIAQSQTAPFVDPFTVLNSANNSAVLEVNSFGEIFARNSSRTPLTIRGARSDSSYQQAVASISSNGSTVTYDSPGNSTNPFVVGSVVTVTGASTAGFNGTFVVTTVGHTNFTVSNTTTGTSSSATATSVGHTADLVQYRDPAGTLIGGRNSVAQMYSGSTTTINTQVGGAVTAGSHDGTAATLTLTSASNLAVGDQIVVTGFTPSGYNGTHIVTAVNNAGPFTVSYRNPNPGATSVLGIVSTPAQNSVIARSAGTIGQIIRGATSQVSDLQIWQNSSGTTLARMDASGNIGAGSIVQTTAKTSAYQLAAVDANTLVQMNGAFAFTVPLNSTTPYPIGTNINLLAITAGVSVTFTGGITFYATPGRNLRAAGSMATLIKLGTDTWVLTGDLTA